MASLTLEDLDAQLQCWEGECGGTIEVECSEYWLSQVVDLGLEKLNLVIMILGLLLQMGN